MDEDEPGAVDARSIYIGNVSPGSTVLSILNPQSQSEGPSICKCQLDGVVCCVASSHTILCLRVALRRVQIDHGPMEDEDEDEDAGEDGS